MATKGGHLVDGRQVKTPSGPCGAEETLIFESPRAALVRASQIDSQTPHTDGQNMETPEITSSPGMMAWAQGSGRERESHPSSNMLR